MKLKAVLFDLGGTLLHYYDPDSDDPERPFRRITRVGVRRLLEQMAAEGAPIPALEALDPLIDRHIGQRVRAAMSSLQSSGSVEVPIRAALEEVGLPVGDDRWGTLRSTFYRAMDGIVTPRAGLIETLTALRDAGHALGLISNTYWAADLHDRHMAEYGLLDFFPVRVYSCDTPYTKPHPAIFALALERMGIDAGKAAYVGDRPDVDVRGAQDAGMRGILIRSPYEHTPLGEVTPDAIIDELPDLISALAQLEAQPR